ncbi:hypothetical protein [Bacillus sp. NEAU-Y102]
MSELSNAAVLVKRDLDGGNGQASMANAKMAEQVYYELKEFYPTLHMVTAGINQHFCTGIEPLEKLEEELKERRNRLRDELDGINVALEQIEISK